MNKKFLRSSVAGFAALVAFSTIAQAADLYTPAPEPTWTGFYVGAHAGYNWADYSGVWTPSEFPALRGRDFTLEGFSGGLHAGYNWQSDNIVFGIEGDVTGANMSDFEDHRNRATGSEYTSSMYASIDLLASVRGRLGFAMDNSLFYVTGGIAFTNADFKACDPRDCGKWDLGDNVGGVVGGGWEYKPASQVSVRLEGLYYIFDNRASLENNRFDVDTDGTADIGVNNYMKFNDAFVIRGGVAWHPWN